MVAVMRDEIVDCTRSSFLHERYTARDDLGSVLSVVVISVLRPVETLPALMAQNARL